MNRHLNIVTICVGAIIVCLRPSWILAPLAGGIVILVECYRAHRVAKKTEEVPAATILDFYRSDIAHRFLDVKSTVRKLREFAEKNSAPERIE